MNNQNKRVFLSNNKFAHMSEDECLLYLLSKPVHYGKDLKRLRYEQYDRYRYKDISEMTLDEQIEFTEGELKACEGVIRINNHDYYKRKLIEIQNKLQQLKEQKATQNE